MYIITLCCNFFSTSFQLTKMKYNLVSAGLLVAWPVTWAISFSKDMQGIEPIRIAAQATGVYIGCAINDEMLFNTDDQKYFDFHFANFMLSNAPEACTWGTIEQTRGIYNYHRCAQSFLYAIDARQLYRAGPIISHAHLPPWFSSLGEQERNEAAMHHVTKVVSHLHEMEVHPGLDVYAWDVLSDVISANGTQLWPDTYLATALSAARAADSHAHLLLRESGAALPGAKGEAMFKLCRTLLKAGTPITGVNLRLHLGVRAVAAVKKTGTPDAWFALSWYDHVGEDTGGHSFSESMENPLAEMHENASVDPEDVAESLETHHETIGVAGTQYDHIIDLNQPSVAPLDENGNPSRRSNDEPDASQLDDRLESLLANRPWAQGTPEKLFEMIYRYHNEGLYVFLTDVQIDIEDNGVAPLSDLLDVQAYAYVALINVCVTIPRCRTLELRSFTDRYGDGKMPYIFDKDYKPKRAHAEMVNILYRWRTKSRSIVVEGADTKKNTMYMVATLTALFIVFVLLMAVGLLHIYVKRRIVQLERAHAEGQDMELNDLAHLAAAIAHIRGAAAAGAYDQLAESEADAEDEEQGSLPSDSETNGGQSTTPATNGNDGYLRVETDEGEASGDENIRST